MLDNLKQDTIHQLYSSQKTQISLPKESAYKNEGFAPYLKTGNNAALKTSIHRGKKVKICYSEHTSTTTIVYSHVTE